MKKDDKNNLRRERFIMMSTSAMVLTALTVTGVYMRNHTQRAQDNGYTIDFSALENSADDKLKEITGNSHRDREQTLLEEEDGILPQVGVGSDEVTIPGLTEGRKETRDAGKTEEMTTEMSEKKTGENTEKLTAERRKEKTTEAADLKKTTEGQKETVTVDQSGSEGMSEGIDLASSQEEAGPVVETAGEGVTELETLHFVEETMQRPVNGTILIEYSMDHSVYFATLDQYKYNPAVIYGAPQGEPVFACTTGRVINIHDDPELGQVLVMDLGDGYQAIYGQIDNIEIPIGAKVEAGMKLGTVAAPTIYYSKEGSNLYFQLKKDGQSLDPGKYY